MEKSDNNAVSNEVVKGGGSTELAGNANGSGSHSTAAAATQHSNSLLVEPFVPSQEIDWESKTAAALAANDEAEETARISTTDIKFDSTFWSYTDPEVEKEFERFLFRDQTSLPIGIGYVIGNLLTAVLQRDRVIPIVWYYVVPASPLLLLLLIVDQIFFYKKSLRNHPHRITVRKVVCLVIAYASLHGGGWYDVYINSLCPPSKFAEGAEYTKERFCTEQMILFTLVPFIAIPGFIKLKVLHQWLFSALLFFLVLLAMAIEGSNYFTFGARHVVVAMIYLGFLSVAMTTLATLRYRAMRRQFVQTVAVTIENRRMNSHRAVVETLLESLVPQQVLPRLMDTVLAQQQQQQQQQQADTKGSSVLEASTASRSMLLSDPDASSAVDFSPAATVLFSDVAGFTRWSSARSAGQVVQMLNVLVSEFDHAAQRLGVERVKTIGDAYWAVCGLPEEVPEHAEVMCAFAREMQGIVLQCNDANPAWSRSGEAGTADSRLGVQIRVGLHSGPLSGAILGSQQVAYEVFGETNDIASLVEQSGVAGQVAVTEAVLEHFPSATERPACFSTFPGTSEPYKLLETTVDGEKRGVKLYLLSSTNNDNDHPHSYSHNTSRRSSLNSQFAPQQHQRRPSVVLVVDAKKAAEQAHRQARFLAALKIRQGQEEGERDIKETEDAGEARAEWRSYEAALTERRYQCCCLGLQDESAERSFEDFVRGQTQSTRLASRVINFLVPLVYLVLYLIDGRNLNLGTLVCWVIALALALPPVWLNSSEASIGGSSGSRAYPAIDLALTILSNLLMLIGTAFSTLPSTTESINIMVNGNIGLFFIPCVTILCSSVAIPLSAGPAFSLFFATVYLPHMFVNMLAETVSFFDALSFGTVAVLTSWLFAYLTERVYRQGFVDRQRAEHFAAKSAELTRAGEDVLLKLVPKHVVPRLLHWINGGMSPAQSITQEYEQVCIGFFRFDSPASAASTDVENSEVEPTSSHWLLQAHSKMDELLGAADDGGEEQQPSGLRFSSLTKIKSIGDLVMVAGPFRRQNSAAGPGEVRQAIAELLRLARCVEEAVGLPARIGLHVGPVMAAVLGTVRPMFDVFGDTVNTTSRVLTSITADDVHLGRSIACSAALVEKMSPLVTCPQSAPPATSREAQCLEANAVVDKDREDNFIRKDSDSTLVLEGLVFDPESEVHAKGKGKLTIRRAYRQ